MSANVEVEAPAPAPAEPPALSVLLPVYDAMPYVTHTVRDILRQELAEGAGLELVCAWDGGNRDAWDFLAELARALPRGAVLEDVAPPPAPAANPAAAAAPRHPEDADHPAVARAPCAALAVADVVAAARPEHALRVVRFADGANRGQGAAMSLALAASRAPLIAQMEADDRRPNAGALRAMVAALEKNGWDGVCSDAVAFGSVSERMAAYVGWQNSLVSPADLAAHRFVEIPVLHQTALFTRRAVAATLGAHETYRDGPDPGSGPGADLDAPVDLWWWLAFFARGLTCGRVASPPAAAPAARGDLPESAFFGWRQHPFPPRRRPARLVLAPTRGPRTQAPEDARPRAPERREPAQDQVPRAPARAPEARPRAPRERRENARRVAGRLRGPRGRARRPRRRRVAALEADAAAGGPAGAPAGRPPRGAPPRRARVRARARFARGRTAQASGPTATRTRGAASDSTSRTGTTPSTSSSLNFFFTTRSQVHLDGKTSPQLKPGPPQCRKDQ